MTSEEKQAIVSEVIAGVLSALRTNSKKIIDLTEVSFIPDKSYIELSGGRRILAENFKQFIQDSVLDEAVMPALREALSNASSGVPTSGELDYSDMLMEGNHYFNASNLRIVDSENDYVMTLPIPVESGDMVVFTGWRSADIPFIVGYTDNEGSNPQVLLGNDQLGGGASSASVCVDGYEVTIPSGVTFIRCAAKGEGRDGAPKMRVILRKAWAKADETGIAPTVFVPKGKRILVCGASFASENNGWTKLVQDMTGITVANKAAGGSTIVGNIVARLMDANNTMPHGSLFYESGRDAFSDYGAIIIQHTQNQNVLLDEAQYAVRDVQWYKDHYTVSNSSAATEAGRLADSFRTVTDGSGLEMDYASAWDYVIKQLKDWCDEAKTGQQIIEKGKTNAMTITRTFPKQQIEILVCSHWTPARKKYNDSSRKLAERHGLGYCAMDKALGFSDNDRVTAVVSYDDNGNPVEASCNKSVLHSQFVSVSVNGGGIKIPTGKAERLNGEYWGWHPITVRPTSEGGNSFGYGTMTNRDELCYVPWIQLAFASCVSMCIEQRDLIIKRGTGEGSVVQVNRYRNSVAAGESAAAFGHDTWATAPGAFAEGWGSHANGNASHAGGTNNIADGHRSFAHGFELRTHNQCEAAFGQYNDSVAGGNKEDATLVSFGNGKSDSERSNAWEVKQDGSIWFWLNNEYVKLQDLLTTLMDGIEETDSGYADGEGHAHAWNINGEEGSSESEQEPSDVPTDVLDWYVGQVTKTASAFAGLTAAELMTYTQAYPITTKEANITIKHSCWFMVVPESVGVAGARYSIGGFTSEFTEQEIKNGFGSEVYHSDIILNGTRYKVYVNRNTALVGSNAEGKILLK
jgi:hypothetical protein